MTVLYILLTALFLIILLTLIEFAVYFSMKPAKELPSENEKDYYYGRVNGKSFEELFFFLSGEKDAPEFSEEEAYEIIKRQCDYMAHRFDCSDFRSPLLFKLYKDFGDKLEDRCTELIKNTFLDFKYFMDEKGDDSMCYWSENHQILFAVSEYLAGQEWQDEVFTNNGMTGREHMKKAKERIDAWMLQRFSYGFSEYLSNNYLAEDISPMANFIAYSEDEESVNRMKIIMDILFLDVALNSTANRFVATSPRMYGNNKAGNFYGNSIQSAMNVLWGEELAKDMLSDSLLSDSEKKLIGMSLVKKPNYIICCFTDIVKKGIYTLPEAIRDIALSKESFVSLMNCGLSPSDLEKEGLVGQEPFQIMAQMGAEAFTNPEVIENTIKYIRENKMYKSSFLGVFRFLELTVLKGISWRKFSSKHYILPHGIAMGRGNIYTYRTPYYTLSTSICKNTDMCGTQDHEWCANIGENLALFTTHPAGDGKSKFGSSPGYWTGNGRIPMSVQNENVNVTIYKIPEKKRLGESGISEITHAYVPKDFYDEIIHKGNVIFLRKNGVFAALISNGEMCYKPFDINSAKGISKGYTFPDEFTLKSEFDLVREGGKYHAYITELSHKTNESFSDFIKRISENEISFTEKGEVKYSTKSGMIEASYDGIFRVDGKDAVREYLRYDSPFCKAERKAKEIKVRSGSNCLYLNFEKAVRKEESISL